MRYRLQDGVSFCHVDDTIIVLDLAQDRYRALRGPIAQTLAALADQSGPIDSDDGWIDTLIRHGIVEAAAGGCEIRPCDAQASTIAPPWGRLPSLRAICSVIATITSTTFILKTRSLQRVLLEGGGEWLASTARSSVARRRPLGDLVRSFSAVDIYTTRSGKCLARSIALAKYVRKRGFAPRILFGVAINPFRAHCWVECDGMLLNDQPDHIRNFVPINVAMF